MKNRNRGFAILEVLISVLIVSFGVLALTKFQANLHSNQDVATHRTEAQGLAEQVVSKVAASATPTAYGNSNDAVQGKSTRYARTWTVNADAVGNAIVNVSVSWLDSRGASDFVSLVSVVSKDGSKQEAKLLQSPPPLAGGAGPLTGSTNPPWMVGIGGAPAVNPAPPTTLPPVVVPPVTSTPPVTYTISGTVTAFSNAKSVPYTISATNVVCTPSGPVTDTATYSCTVPDGWSGTVSITTTGTATPRSYQYANVFTNKTLNFNLSR